MKKKILSLLLVIMMVITITGCGKTKKETKVDEPIVKENTNEGIVKEQTVDGIEFTNTSLKTINGMSTIETKITNNTDSDYDKDKFMIIIKDKNGKVMQEIPGYITSVIPAGESLTISSGVDVDLSDADSVEYKADE